MKKDTVCSLCSSCCPVEVEVAGHTLVRARRKSLVAPANRLSCARLAAAADIVTSPGRLTTPLIRTSNGADFRESTWEEAIALVAQKFIDHKEQAGAQSVAWLRGMAADWGTPWDYANRLMNLFGSPNTIGNGSSCSVARDMAQSYTYGSMAFPEPRQANCIIVWGKNVDNSSLSAAEDIRHAMKNGAKIIVIDPVRTALANRADLWLQIKPGHDGLLAMAMIHVIISEKLYESDFVDRYTVGFAELKKTAAQYSPRAVSEQLWLTAEQIRLVSHIYATAKPASIIDGNGLDMHREVFQSTRAIAMLRALTGNLDKPGGDALPKPVPVRNIQMRERLHGALPITHEYPLFNSFSDTWGNQVQGCVIDAILDRSPYPLNMVVVQSGNPVITMADANRARKAFARLETLVVIDMFMTETAKLADVILPASSCFEKTQLNRSSIRNNPIFLQRGVIPPVGSSWPDWKIVFELGRKLGFAAEFPWTSVEEAIDYQLEPTGITVKELLENEPGFRLGAHSYEKYKGKGFDTPSGKVEFYSPRLAQAGFAAVPFQDGPGDSSIGFADCSDEYPMLGMSGSRDIRFTNTQFRTIPSLLKDGAGCIVDIHPDDARLKIIADGDEIRVETPKGAIEMKARISPLVRAGTVCIAWGWGEYDARSNLNVLTEDDKRSTITGTSTSRSFMCRVRRRA
ncbi:MAG: formate dehydrogenase [Desulfobulbaceae bacterium BRH_c16a]|nr:MAG: formate dehydrogenase [Desulfobulbaceae bacterium BRH_c16a]